MGPRTSQPSPVSRSSAILVVLAAVSILTGCVTAAPRQGGPLRECFETHQRGIFTEETLSCFPELRERLREPLCRLNAGVQPHLIALGFGIGVEVYGQTVRLQTRVGACERESPELTEEPWRKLCAER